MRAEIEANRRSYDLVYRLCTEMDGKLLRAHVRGLGQSFARKYADFLGEPSNAGFAEAFRDVFGDLDGGDPEARGCWADNSAENRRSALMIIFYALLWDAEYREWFLPTPPAAGGGAPGTSVAPSAPPSRPQVDVTTFNLWFLHHLTPLMDRFLDGSGEHSTVTALVLELATMYVCYLPGNPATRPGRATAADELDTVLLASVAQHAAEVERAAAEFANTFGATTAGDVVKMEVVAEEGSTTTTTTTSTTTTSAPPPVRIKTEPRAEMTLDEILELD
jgi:hypothetical protein